MIARHYVSPKGYLDKFGSPKFMAWIVINFTRLGSCFLWQSNFLKDLESSRYASYQIHLPTALPICYFLDTTHRFMFPCCLAPMPLLYLNCFHWGHQNTGLTEKSLSQSALWRSARSFCLEILHERYLNNKSPFFCYRMYKGFSKPARSQKKFGFLLTSVDKSINYWLS